MRARHGQHNTGRRNWDEPSLAPGSCGGDVHAHPSYKNDSGKNEGYEMTCRKCGIKLISRSQIAIMEW